MLQDKLRELAQLRLSIEMLEAQRDLADEALRETKEFAELEVASSNLKEANKQAKALEDEVRILANLNYVAYKPSPEGITIKNFKVLKVLDDKIAKVWMATNAPALLSYNDSKLLKAVENLELDWATVETEPRVQISSNLDMYLENKDEP